MINLQLLDYIRQQLSRNISKEEIKNILLSNGWEAADVEEGFNSLVLKPIIPPVFITPSITPVTPIIPVVNPVLNSQPQPVQPTPAQIVNSENNSLKKKSSWNPFSHKGRIGRLRYFLSSLILWIIFLLISAGIIFLSILTGGLVGILVAMIPITLLVIIVFVIDLLLSSKRFHDLNKSGWHALLLIIPFYSVYPLLGLLLQCGTGGVNQYGDDPLTTEKNHNDFLNKLGKNIPFKIIITILLSVLFIISSYENALAKQEAEKEMDQSILNSLKTSSINIPVTNTINNIPVEK